VAVVALGVCASIGAAQSRPYGGDDQLSVTGAPGAGVPLVSTQVYNYPAEEVRAVPPAKAAAAVARAVQNREYNALNGAVRDTVRSFEKSDELKKAIEAEQAAYAEYEKAREAALRDLRNDPKYQAQIDLANQLKSKIVARHEAPKSKDDDGAAKGEIAAMAAIKFDYANAAKARETDALAKSGDVQAARRKLIDARARVTDLRGRFEGEVRTDENIVAARRSFWDAKINRLGAEAYLDGVLEARDIALHYTYWINKHNKYGQGYRYAGGGYGYDLGYGYGYPTYPYVPR
jgi:hypothetical protein